ncbi:MAG: hypothetical protein J6C05_03160 [Prevotella sp.]|nr:hypothetical protein [Prevotella sp.]MBO5156116.1 hypothetical protein [Prevotella sp.]
MNKITLPLVALSAIAAPVQMHAAGMTNEEKAAAIQEMSNTLSRAINNLNNGSEYHEQVKSKYLTEASNLMAEVNKLTEKSTDLEITTCQAKVNQLGIDIDNAEKPYDAYDEIDVRLKELEQALKTGTDNLNSYPNVKDKYEKLYAGVGVPALRQQVDGYDLNTQDIVNAKTDILNSIKTKLATVKGYNDGIAKANELAGNSAASYEANEAAIKKFEETYFEQLNTAIKALPSEGYEDWQKKAIEDLNEQNRIVQDIKNKDAAYKADTENKTCEDKTAEISAALSQVQNIVSGYAKNKEVQEEAKKTADAAVKEKQDILDGMKKALKDRGITSCDADINAVQALINNLKSTINTRYAAHTVNTLLTEGNNYTAKLTGIQEAINNVDDSASDNKGHKYQPVLDNYDAYKAVLDAAKTAQTALDAAKTEAEKQSDDKAYTVASKYTKTINDIQTTITKVNTDAENAYKAFKAEEQKTALTGTANTQKTNADNLKTDATNLLKKYNEIAKKISDTQTALDDLSKTATDKGVTTDGTVGGTTYEKFINDTQAAIDALKKKLNEANAKADAAHKTALNAIEATIAGSEDIKTNKDNYANNKENFDNKTAVEAAQNCINNATSRMTALETVINAIDVAETTVGNQSGTLTTEKTALVNELNAAGVGDKIEALRTKFGTTDEDHLKNASAVVAGYAEINTALETMEKKAADLTAKANAAADNFTAYKATVKLYSDGGNSAVEKAIKALGDKITAKATGAAKTYYEGEKTKLENKFKENGDIYKAIEKSYTDKKSVADKDTHAASIAAVKAQVDALTAAIEQNELKHTDQIKALETLNKTWQGAYDAISANDQSTKAKEYLAQLAKELEKINALDTEISKAFGAGQSNDRNSEFSTTNKAISDAISDILAKQKEGYSAQITADNKASHEVFVSKYNAAYQEFGNAVETLDKFCSIKNEALAVATENYITTHDAIYEYAEKLRTLKANEQADYDKYTTSPEDDVFDNTKWNKDADDYKSEIANLLSRYCDAVNTKAYEIFKTTYDDVDAAVKANEAKVADFKYGKTDAFKDVKDVLAEADQLTKKEGETVTLDQKYALSVDGWLESLKNYEDMLTSDLAKAYNTEKDGWLNAINTLYNTEKTAIEALKGIDESKADILKNLKALYDGSYGEAKKLDKDIDATKAEGQTAINNIVAKCKTYNTGATVDNGTNLKHSKIYEDAKKASDDAIANDKVYAEIISMIDAADKAADNAEAWVKEMYVNQNSEIKTKLQAIETMLKNVREGAEDHKGASADYKATAEGVVKASSGTVYTSITDLKKLAIEKSLGENGCLKERINAVKEEYNKLAATDLDAAKAYEAVIANYYTELLTDVKNGNNEVVAECLTNKYAQGKLTDNNKIEAAKKALVDFENKVASTYMEINKKLNNSQVADAKKAVAEAISAVEEKIVEAQGWADYNDATGKVGNAIVAELNAELNAIKADVEAKGDDVLFYKNNITSAIDALSEAVDNNCGDLEAEYNKQKTNDEVYAAIVGQTDALNTALTASYDKIKDLGYVTSQKDVDVTVKGEDGKETTKKVNPFDKAYNYEIAADIEKIKAAAEQAHKDVTLEKGDDENLTVGDGNVKTAAKAVEKAIADKETEAKAGEADARLAEFEKALKTDSEIDKAIKDNNYSPAKEKELIDALTALKNQVKAAQDYNEDAKDGEISKDIDGNKIKDNGGNETTEKVDYNTTAWEALQTRITELNNAVDKLKSDIDGYAYTIGDADHDGSVTVNDYSVVRDLILSATKYEDVEDEAMRFGADANSDKQLSVGDLSAISNIIFYGDPQGENTDAAPSKARTRVAVAEDDEITVTKESEETSVFGKTVRLAVNLTHSETFTAGQFDITLPEGLKLAGESLSDRANGHEVYFNAIGDNTYRTVVATIDNKEFNGRSGTIVYLDVEVSSGFNGNADINVSNAIFSKASGACYSIGGDGNGATGIDGIEAATMKERVYSIGGQIRKAVSKGINIIVGEDGKTKKVIKK